MVLVTYVLLAVAKPVPGKMFVMLIISKEGISCIKKAN